MNTKRMTLRSFIMAVALLLPFNFLCAQEKNDSIQQPKVTEKVKTKTIKIDECKQLKQDQKSLVDTKAQLEKSKESSKAEQEAVSLLKNDKNQLLQQIHNDSVAQVKAQGEITALKEKIEEADKHLINMAANFLWLPYEDYSIQSIAIPACESVQSEKQKQNCAERKEILKEYKSDVKALYDLLSQKRFGGNMSVEWDLQKLKELPAYARYHKYNWLEGSYLYDKIQTVENRLNSIKENKPTKDFKDIISQLENCLKTIE